jgi:hypothetical protein
MTGPLGGIGGSAALPPIFNQKITRRRVPSLAA